MPPWLTVLSPMRLCDKEAGFKIPIPETYIPAASVLVKGQHDMTNNPDEALTVGGHALVSSLIVLHVYQLVPANLWEESGDHLKLIVVRCRVSALSFDFLDHAD